ncbi:hypothetical protein V8F20_010193 [Naviculisporaceae sp. PSN 640]
MTRQAVQTALGRVVRTSPTTAATVIRQGQCLTARTFSTTQTTRSDEDNNTKSNENATGRQKSAQAAAKLGQLVRREPFGPPAGARDARSLGAKVTPTAGSKVINLRSLRDRPAGALPRFRLAGGAGGASGAPRPGGVQGLGSGRFTGGTSGASKFGGARPGGRFGAPGGARSRGRPGAGAGGSGYLARKRQADKAKKAKEDRLNDRPVDRPWSAAEMEVLDRLDQGELTTYTPQATLESLVGYGPAIATDNTLGKLESALHTMRVMGGGRAFDNDPASTVDPRAYAKRYFHEKEPVFFNTVEEKKWLHRALARKVEGPPDVVKEAIIETVVKGKYVAPEFKDLSDVKGIVANYQNRDASYRPSHCQEFTEKLVSILPPAKAGKAAPARS